jgi:integrase/recombinase XerD
VAEGARLESVFTRKGNVGSNPTLSASIHSKGLKGVRPSGYRFGYVLTGSIIAILDVFSVLSRKDIPMKVSLNVREHVTRKYRKAKSTEPAGTIYVLRYGGTWETLDAENWNDARVAQLRKEAALLKGWRPKVEKRKPAGLMLDAATDAYLSEISSSRKKKTHQAYTVALRYFYECVGNKPIKDITRGDLVKFSVFLREDKEQSPRSCWNKFSNVMSFLKYHEVKPKVKPHDWPKFVEEEPEIYDQETLDKFFAVCDDDELLLFEFFLQTGMREQEVIYATDRSLEFSNCTVSVKHNPEYHWTPKAYKERTIPVPKVLMAKLKAMLVKRGKRGLLFPTKNGLPKFNFLDIAKAIAKRAGIDESEVWLHRFRSTFCTRSLWSNIDLRTVQDWMGHVDLASTLRYLKPDRSKAMREKVEAIWSAAA